MSGYRTCRLASLDFTELVGIAVELVWRDNGTPQGLPFRVTLRDLSSELPRTRFQPLLENRLGDRHRFGIHVAWFHPAEYLEITRCPPYCMPGRYPVGAEVRPGPHPRGEPQWFPDGIGLLAGKAVASFLRPLASEVAREGWEVGECPCCRYGRQQPTPHLEVMVHVPVVWG